MSLTFSEGVSASMVFKKMLGSLGVGGPTVDTVLDGRPVTPGGTLTGQVHLRGGKAAFDIQHITLELVALVEAERAGGEQRGAVVFQRFTVGGDFPLNAEEQRTLPFSLPLPWETPFTEMHGQPLGVPLGVRTELAIAAAKDSGVMDPLAVSPLPAQAAILQALGELGFAFKSADLELGHIRGSGQQLPFYQEIELYAAPQYAQALRELEVTFLTTPGGMEVILEADKRGGLFTGGHDAVHRHTVAHQGAETQDWATQVTGWLEQLVQGHGAQAGFAPYGQGPGFPAPYGGHHGHGYGGHNGQDYGDHHEHEGQRRGPGVGGMVAAGAAGLAAGVVGGMVLNEVFDDDSGDGGDEAGGDEGDGGGEE
jgi:sporulation-control protein